VHDITHYSSLSTLEFLNFRAFSTIETAARHNELSKHYKKSLNNAIVLASLFQASETADLLVNNKKRHSRIQYGDEV
jgi:hypothetical protein